jgi:release factor glutamine methyltransferase
METLDALMRRWRTRLKVAGAETPALDVRLLTREGAGLSDADIIAGGNAPLSTEQIARIESFIARRAAGEPVSRILGYKEFYGRMFKLTPDTLDPRPDTETLIGAALAEQKRPLRILDLGTGTGCILLTLLAEWPDATGVGIDLNPGATDVSRENAARLGVGNRVEFLCGSWFTPLKEGQVFDLIVSNPPYIPESQIDSLAKEVKDHDPFLALSGGEDGLEAYKIIFKDLKNHLACGGFALFEIGQGQEKDLARLSQNSNMTRGESYTDLGGIVRVIKITHGEN